MTLGMINDHKECMRAIETIIPAAMRMAGSLDADLGATPFAKVLSVAPTMCAHRSVSLSKPESNYSRDLSQVT